MTKEMVSLYEQARELQDKMDASDSTMSFDAKAKTRKR